MKAARRKISATSAPLSYRRRLFAAVGLPSSALIHEDLLCTIPTLKDDISVASAPCRLRCGRVWHRLRAVPATIVAWHQVAVAPSNHLRPRSAAAMHCGGGWRAQPRWSLSGWKERVHSERNSLEPPGVLQTTTDRICTLMRAPLISGAPC